MNCRANKQKNENEPNYDSSKKDNPFSRDKSKIVFGCFWD